MNSQELRNLQEAYLEVYQNQNISEEPIQDYRDRRRAAENKSGLRGPELSNSGSSKGTPKPGSASVRTTGPSSPGYDTRRLGGSDLRRLSTPSPTLQSKGTYKPGSASVSKPVRSREFAREDMFDLVKGHLLDEGYADTEEAAIAIMANMSEEWRESILESGYFPTPESQRDDEAKYKLRGQNVKPRTTQTQIGAKMKPTVNK
jgi:hypothetical protein